MSNSSQNHIEQKRAALLVVVAMVIGFAVGLQFGGSKTTADAGIDAASEAPMQAYPEPVDQLGRE